MIGPAIINADVLELGDRQRPVQTRFPPPLTVTSNEPPSFAFDHAVGFFRVSIQN